MQKSKDEALGVFKKFRAQVEDGAEKKIKVFSTDRGGELSRRPAKACDTRIIFRLWDAPTPLNESWPAMRS